MLFLSTDRVRDNGSHVSDCRHIGGAGKSMDFYGMLQSYLILKALKCRDSKSSRDRVVFSYTGCK